MTTTYKPFGYSLLISTVCMIITMVMHPVGGDFNHLLRISKVAIISHSLAICALPFFTFGFYGVYIIFRSSVYSLFAFILICLSQFSLLIAATINGLILPLFIRQYAEADEVLLQTIKPILKYGSTINMAFDYIAISSLCIAVSIWSILILEYRIFVKWIGWFGIALVLGVLLLTGMKYSLTSVTGFTVFILGLASWVVCIGVNMIRKQY